MHWRRVRKHGQPGAAEPKQATSDRTYAATRRTLERVEELLFLLSCGVAVTEALTRVGWSVGAAKRWSYRHHRRDVLTALGVGA